MADLNDRIARVQAHMNRLVAQRDRKHAQIPLTDRERIAWQRKIDVAAGTIAGLEAERRALLS